MTTKPSAAHPGCRRFAPADAIILVAAVGVGLAWKHSQIYHLLFVENETVLTGGNYWMNVIASYFFLLVSFLLVGLPAYLMIRLRRPRPASRRLLRQPGMVAACAVVLQITLSALGPLDSILQIWLREGVSKIHLDRLYITFASGMVTTYNAGYVVAGAWLTLGLCRLWRAEPGWIDRLGRVLGVLWIVTIWQHSMYDIALAVGDFVLRHHS